MDIKLIEKFLLKDEPEFLDWSDNNTSSSLIDVPPLPESFGHFSPYDHFHILQSPYSNQQQFQFDDIDLDAFTWNENSNNLCSVTVQSCNSNNNNMNNSTDQTEKGKKRTRDVASRLSGMQYDDISKYFCMPITRAAEEINVGLTVLKKKCRELGIARWPHRKINSLKSLIHNVQEELEKGKVEDVNSRIELETLEELKSSMEQNPDMELTARTKRLRQAFFKANYRKRRGQVSGWNYSVSTYFK